MRHGKTFRKRFLTFLLSLAMVFTSVNVPMLTVRAEEETPVENGNTEVLTTDDGSNEPTTPEGGDELTTPTDDNEGTPEDSVMAPENPEESDSEEEDPEETLEPVAPVKENTVDPEEEETSKAVTSISVESDDELLVSSDIDLTGIEAVNDATVFTNGWNAWTDAGITAEGAANSTVTFTYPAGKCAKDWALQLQTAESIDLVQGDYYTLAFTAESSIPRSIEVCTGGSWPRQNDLKYKLPAKQATKVVYVFEAEVTAKSKIQFLLGTQQDDKSPLWEQEGGHTLKLSNISLVKGKAADDVVGANASVATNSDKSGLDAAIKECEEPESVKLKRYEP